MRHCQEFTWKIFINMVDNMSYKQTGIRLTKLEKQLLKCYWNNMSRQSIIEVLNRKRLELNYYYSENYYFSMGLEPNLMKKLSILINRSVNKTNFKEVFRQEWEKNS